MKQVLYEFPVRIDSASDRNRGDPAKVPGAEPMNGPRGPGKAADECPSPDFGGQRAFNHADDGFTIVPSQA